MNRPIRRPVPPLPASSALLPTIGTAVTCAQERAPPRQFQPTGADVTREMRAFLHPNSCAPGLGHATGGVGTQDGAVLGLGASASAPPLPRRCPTDAQPHAQGTTAPGGTYSAPTGQPVTGYPAGLGPAVSSRRIGLGRPARRDAPDNRSTLGAMLYAPRARVHRRRTSTTAPSRPCPSSGTRDCTPRRFRRQSSPSRAKRVIGALLRLRRHLRRAVDANYRMSRPRRRANSGHLADVASTVQASSATRPAQRSSRLENPPSNLTVAFRRKACRSARARRER